MIEKGKPACEDGRAYELMLRDGNSLCSQYSTVRVKVKTHPSK